jgi:hypothetical protein
MELQLSCGTVGHLVRSLDGRISVTACNGRSMVAATALDQLDREHTVTAVAKSAREHARARSAGVPAVSVARVSYRQGHCRSVSRTRRLLLVASPPSVWSGFSAARPVACRSSATPARPDCLSGRHATGTEAMRRQGQTRAGAAGGNSPAQECTTAARARNLDCADEMRLGPSSHRCNSRSK